MLHAPAAGRCALAFHNLAADLAAFVGFGVNVDVPHAFLEVGSLGVGKRR